MSEEVKQVLVIFDPPMPVANAFPSKEALERAQLEKYRLDYLLQHGQPPFEDVRRGKDPPDFFVDVGGRHVGLDCAALALQVRRRAEAMFETISGYVAQHASDRRLGHLAGCDIPVWFNFGRSTPPTASEKADLAEIVRELEAVTVDRERIAAFSREISEKGFPQRFPEGMPIVNRGWFGFQVTPRTEWQPRSALGAELGFNLVLHYPVRVADVREEVQRLVEGHDNEKTEHLLLIAGGPNRKGVCFPGEAFSALAIRDAPPSSLSARNIRRVTLHIWTSGEIVELPVCPAEGAA
jgi:hypothetical protein